MMAVLAVGGAMLISSLAYAAPRELSSGDLDTVAAGAYIDQFIPTMPNSVNTNAEFAYGDIAEAVGGAAIVGDANEVTLAGATCDGIAVIGNDNITADNSNVVDDGAEVAIAGNHNSALRIDQEDAVAALVIGPNATFDITFNDVEGLIDDGSAVVIGDNNLVDVYMDDTDVYGTIGGNFSLVDTNTATATIAQTNTANASGESSADITQANIANITINQNGDNDDAYGVIAKEAKVDHAFNVDELYVDVSADICGSFNKEDTAISICGQNGVSTNVNGNAAGLQEIGSLLNTTNAAASGTGALADNGSSISADAFADTAATQIVLNGVCVGIGIFVDGGAR
jgi:hypothetical protein